MKYAKAHSLRTQQAIARYGKAARHPLCLAALELWRLDAELSKWSKNLVSIEEVLNSAKQMRKKACTPALLRKIDNHLLKSQTRYQAAVKLRSFNQEGRRWAVELFERERDCVIRTGDAKARRALQRVRKRWNEKGTFLGDSDRRTLEILKMLREEVSDEAWRRGGAIAGYTEAARSGGRALSDKAWQELLTAPEIQSRLVDAPGDRHGKEVRRLAKKLWIRLAQDKPGRKCKWPYPPKQEPKQPRGRPRTGPDIIPVNDLEAIQASKAAAERGKIQRARIAAG